MNYTITKAQIEQVSKVISVGMMFADGQSIGAVQSMFMAIDMLAGLQKQDDAKPYAIEAGFCNGDGTYSVRIEKMPLSEHGLSSKFKDWEMHEKLLFIHPPKKQDDDKPAGYLHTILNEHFDQPSFEVFSYTKDEPTNSVGWYELYIHPPKNS